MELSSVKSLPPELIIEILTWLPLKSVLRCRCVSKLCYAATQEDEFIKKHRSRNRYPSTIPFTRDENGLRAVVGGEKFRWIGESQGIVLLETTHTIDRQYRLWNSATEEIFSNLPIPSKPPLVTRICVLPTTHHCKLVNVHLLKQELNTFRLGCEVLTFGIDSSWRPLEISCFDDVLSEEQLSEVTVMSKVLYIIIVMDDYSRLVCLEMGNERVTTIDIPRHFFSDTDWDWGFVNLLKWKNKPSVASLVQDDLNLWQLEDYKKKKWAEKKIVISLTILNKYPNMRGFYHVKAKGDELILHTPSWERLAYNVQSQKVIFSTPFMPSRKIEYSVTPSLARLEGMQSGVKPKAAIMNA